VAGEGVINRQSCNTVILIGHRHVSLSKDRRTLTVFSHIPNSTLWDVCAYATSGAGDRQLEFM
jgi:hypothetical protein